MEIITSTSPDIAARELCVTESASGAIGIKSGIVVITKLTAAVMTLALPVAGADDGKSLTVIDSTGAAHTVTTPANGLNGNKLTATFNGTLGIQVTFRAYNGLWWVLPGGVGIALT
jgi:hypothetical protein